MVTYTDVYHEAGVIAFVPDDITADPDFGKIGVFARDNTNSDSKDRLFFYPWLVAQRSKSDHVLGTPVTRIDPNTWRLQDNDATGASGWFDPLVPTEEFPVRLRRVAKTKARTLATPQPINDWDSLEYYTDKGDSSDKGDKGDGSDGNPTTVVLDTLNDSSASSPHA